MKAFGAFGTILLLLLSGCGEPPTGTVRGKVAYKGKPVVLGVVSFIIDGSLPKYTALAKDGSYEVSGVPVGECSVLVTSVPASDDETAEALLNPEVQAKRRAVALKAAKEAGWFPIPPEYGDVQRTPLRFTVQKGENQYDIKLE